MIALALIRHGPTDWNEQRRIQGHADRRLSSGGRDQVSGWTVPDDLQEFRWVASPLTRAAETATLLGLAFETESDIVEMDWGEWEGATIDDLRARYGKSEIDSRTSLGLDLRPHGGESPREVRTRVAAWAQRIAAAGKPTGAVAHQGVIRALLSLATGWNMIGKPPHKLDWASAHVFSVVPDGEVTIDRLNISLCRP